MEILKEVLSAENRIRPYILETPLEHSPWLKEELGADVWLKLEHIQTTGSFKLRGAANKLLSLSAEEAQGGVITASTGNHGAAVAYMAQKLGIPCQVYLPSNVKPAKVALMKLYGAVLQYEGEDSLVAEETAREAAQIQGLPFISPYNDPLVVAGQGTLGLELDRQVPVLDAVFVPVGGGGLISGVGGYLKESRDAIEVIGCQPTNSPVMHESIKEGRVLDLPSLDTWSDGTAGGLETDSITFDLCQKYVDDWVQVSEDEIEGALRFLLEKHYLMVEGAAGLALASLIKEKERFRGKTLCLILCGRKMGLQGLRNLI